MYPAKDIQIHSCNTSDPVDRFYQWFHDTDKPEHAQTNTTGSAKLDGPPRGDYAVITINNDLDNTSFVKYQAFGTCAGSVKNVECFKYIPDCSANVRRDDYYIPCINAGLKTQKSLKKVFTFLSGNSNVRGKMTEMVVGKSAIVERLEVEEKNGGGKVKINYTQFCETKCKIRSPVLHPLSTTPPGAGLGDTQFLNLRSSNLKAKDKIEEFSSVNILSGICLFSQEHLGYLHGESASAPNKSETTPIDPLDHLVPLPLDQRPTLYEIESLVRLPNNIADIVSTLPAELDATITLDVPRVQYYAFLLDLYAGGRCSREHIKSWLEIIDRRHDQIAEVFERAVQDALQRRGVDRDNVRIELSTGLEEVIPYIQETINRGNSPSVEDLLQKLLELDPLFREYYENLPQPQPPLRNLVDLCLTSYTYQVLRPVFQRVHENRAPGSGFDGQAKSPVGRQLLINIDNVAEWRIYSEAEKMLKGYQIKHSSVINPLLLGIFPIELIFTARNTGRTSLYLKNIGQYIYDKMEGKAVGPSGIVEKVYGIDMTRRVVDWMRQKGMFDMSSMLVASDGPFSGGSSSRSDESSPTTEWDSSEGSPRGPEHGFEGYELKRKLEALNLD